MKVALITGASSGIGRALAQLLSQHGYRLILTGRNEVALRELQSIAEGIVAADLATEHGRDVLVDAIKEYKPDLVINNAGLGYYGNAERVQSDEIIDVNIKALVVSTLAARDAFLDTKRAGVIVNVASILSFFPMPYMSVYAASKAFVASFSEALDYELKGTGIRVLTSCPGQVATEFRARASHGASMHKKNSFFVISPEEAAKAIYEQIQDVARVRVVNRRSRLLYWLTRCIPKSVLLSFLGRKVQERVQNK